MTASPQRCDTARSATSPCDLERALKREPKNLAASRSPTRDSSSPLTLRARFAQNDMSFRCASNKGDRTKGTVPCLQGSVPFVQGVSPLCSSPLCSQNDKREPRIGACPIVQIMIVYCASGRMKGKSSTSRIEGLSVRSMTRRSMPMPMPPAGGMPYSSARI